MDWMEQERERGITITSAATTCSLARPPRSTSSTPPATSTSPSRSSAACACSTAPSPCSARRRRRAPVRDGVAPGRQYNVPRIAFVNKMDRVGADFDNVVQMMRDRLGAQPCPSSSRSAPETIPRHDRPGRDEGASIYDGGPRARRSTSTTIPPTCAMAAGAARERLVEAARRVRRRAAGKFLDGQRAFAPESSCARCAAGTLAGQFVPGALRLGLQEQGRAAAARRGRRLPAVAARHAAGRRATTRTSEPSSSAPAAPTTSPSRALAFKIMTDPYVGKLTLLPRLLRARSRPATRCSNATTGKQRAHRPLLQCTPTSARRSTRRVAGDIAAVIGLKELRHRRHAVRCRARRSCSRR